MSIRRLLARVLRVPTHNCPADRLAAELAVARSRISALDAILARLRVERDAAVQAAQPQEEPDEPAPAWHELGREDLLRRIDELTLEVKRGTGTREDLLRERDTNRRLAGEVHRLSLASEARDVEIAQGRQ